MNHIFFFLASNNARNIWSFRHLCTNYLFMTDSTTEAAPHNGVGHDERNKQRAVIELLVAGKISEKHPLKYLQCYRTAEALLVAGRKQWQLAKQEKQSSVVCLVQATLKAVSPAMLQRADAIVREDRSITTLQLALRISISKGSVNHIIRGLGCSKVWAKWVPRSLTVEKKNTERRTISSELLVRFQAEGRDLPIPDCYSKLNLGPSFWTGDKKAIHGLTLSSISPEKKIKKFLSAGKVMITVFWDCEGVTCKCDAERGDI
jgi:hypothetical protein